MNLREMARITLPTLPSATEKDTRSAYQKFINAIKLLFSRDSDKEQRIRKLEELLSRGTGKNSIDKYFGIHWRIIAPDDGTNNLYMQYSADGITWVSKFTLTP